MCRENLFSLPNTCFLWNKPAFFGGAAKKNAPVNGLLRMHQVKTSHAGYKNFDRNLKAPLNVLKTLYPVMT